MTSETMHEIRDRVQREGDPKRTHINSLAGMTIKRVYLDENCDFVFTVGKRGKVLMRVPYNQCFDANRNRFEDRGIDLK